MEILEKRFIKNVSVLFRRTILPFRAHTVYRGEKMINTKAIVLLIAASVLVAVVAGIAFTQYVGAQGSGTNTSQTQQPTTGTTGTTYPYPQQSYSPYVSSQNGYTFGNGRGMGMCGRF
jgi:hypothetical protein